MNYKLIIIVLLLTTIVVWNQSFSQDKHKSTDDQMLEIIECYPDCPDDLWLPQPATNYLTAGPFTYNGCTFTIDYKYRVATCWQELKYDFLIRKIDIISGNCYFDILTFLEIAQMYLLNNNTLGFPEPDEGDCIDSWRVINDVCWALHESGGVQWLTGCSEDEECCLQRFMVCKDEGELSILKVSSNSSGIICNDPCINVCDEEE